MTDYVSHAERNASFIPPFTPQEATDNCINPVMAAATGIMRLQDAKNPLGREAVEAALADQVVKIAQGDFSGVEEMLICQTQMLNKIFAYSMEKFAEDSWAEDRRLYGTMALKAQSYCRMTALMVMEMKKAQQEVPSQSDTPQENLHKPANELLSAVPKEDTKPQNPGKPANEVLSETNNPQPTIIRSSYDPAMDTAGTRTAGGDDPQLEAVDEMHRQQNP